MKEGQKREGRRDEFSLEEGIRPRHFYKSQAYPIVLITAGTDVGLPLPMCM